MFVVHCILKISQVSGNVKWDFSFLGITAESNLAYVLNLAIPTMSSKFGENPQTSTYIDLPHKILHVKRCSFLKLWPVSSVSLTTLKHNWCCLVCDKINCFAKSNFSNIYNCWTLTTVRDRFSLFSSLFITNIWLSNEATLQLRLLITESILKSFKSFCFWYNFRVEFTSSIEVCRYWLSCLTHKSLIYYSTMEAVQHT